MTLRGIRGAVQVPADTAESIAAATEDLLLEMVERNGVDPASLTAIWFTQTSDLTTAHAPAAARALGWNHVPLLGAVEAPVADSLPRVVRALMLAPLEVDLGDVRHVYLGTTSMLRPDLDRGESA